MINDVLISYDNALLYRPNDTFLFFFIFLVLASLLCVVLLVKFVRSLRLVVADIRQLSAKKSSKKQHIIQARLKQTILLGKAISRFIDNTEKKALNRIHKVLDVVAREILIPVILIFIIPAISGIFIRPVVFAQKPFAAAYQFPWPGILPDHPLYKLKVLRNKITYNIIYSPVKRVEFDLLMADKMLYAGKLLLDKREGDLAKETALKGENYFSILVADYAKIAARKGTIPEQLRVQIDLAYVAHQQLISYLYDKAPEQDKRTYQDIDFFSDENYRVLQNLQNPQPKQ